MNLIAWNYASNTVGRLLLDDSTSVEDKRYAASFLPDIAKILSNMTFGIDAHSHPKEIATVLDFIENTRASDITEAELVKFSSLEGISLPVLSIGVGIALLGNERNTKRAMFFLTQHGRINGLSDMAGILARADPWVALPEQTVYPEHLTMVSDDQHKNIVAGRVTGVRRHKKTTFIDISTQPESLQLALNNEEPPLGEKVSLGDYISATGSFGVTQKGAKTIFVETITSHIKPGLVAPSKLAQAWQEAQEEGQVLCLLRQGLASLGFSEVQTATLSYGYEGGSSRPFISFENSSAKSQYLRVTSELELLKLISGGAQKIFEIGKSFRNERNVDKGTKEFLMLEAYSAMDSFEEFSEQFCSSILSKAFGRQISFKKKTFAQVAEETIGMTNLSVPGVHAYVAAEMPEICAENYSAEALIEAVYNRKIVPLIQEPTVLTELPMNGSPLIKGEGSSAHRHWVVIHGMELAEISENEVDCANLSKKFNRQFSAEEGFIHRDYTDFLNAMNQGMPRTVGVGLGCKRLLEAIHIDREKLRLVGGLSGLNL